LAERASEVSRDHFLLRVKQDSRSKVLLSQPAHAVYEKEEISSDS